MYRARPGELPLIRYYAEFDRPLRRRRTIDATSAGTEAAAPTPALTRSGTPLRT